MITSWNDLNRWTGVRRPYLAFVVLVAVISAISLNIAWLNPRPDYEVVKVPSIPLGWQYNLDSGMNLLSATYFPKYFEYNPQRVSRPVSYLFAHVFGVAVEGISKPIHALSPLMAHAAGFIALKALVYFMAAAVLFQLLLFYMPVVPAFLASFFLLTHHFSLTYISTFVDTEAQWMSPIFIAFLFHNLCQNYSVRKNILFSMAVGVLMLTKQNYPIYIAIVLWGLWEKRTKEVLISLASYCVPYLLWRGYVAWEGIPYFNTQIVVEKYGVAYIQELLSTGLLQTAQAVLYSWRDYIQSCFMHYHVALLLFLVFFKEFYARFGKKFFVFFGLFVFANWAQFFGTRKILNPIMVGDFAFIIWAGGALAAYELLTRLTPKFQRIATVTLLAIWFSFNLLSLVNFPWLHPRDQKEHSMKEKYLAEDAPVPTYKMFPQLDSKK